ncbi:MAG TPA: hypothetical protein VF950_26330 [Planctomycetota bacterium]
MPVFELGYRHWEGERTSPWLRWTAISRTGISLAFRSKILRRLVFIAWAPLLYFGPFFFGVGYVTDSKLTIRERAEWTPMLRGVLGKDMAQRVQNDPESLRPLIWSVAFHRFIAVPQGLIMILLVAIAGAPLIAQDVGSKAFLVYFSKPITKWEYLLGKAGTVMFFILLVTLFPALVLYAVSIAVSPSMRAVGDTWTTVPRLFASAAAVSIPATALILFLSSLAREARYVAFGWIAIWALGETSYLILRTLPALQGSTWILLVSPWECVNAVTGAIFDVPSQIKELGINLRRGPRSLLLSSSPAGPAAAWLAAVSLVCFAGLARRVSAPMRI